ncbi:MAG: methylated-DNA--[protein]-cysteine S-methyltransferase [Candidatus Thorarchaeota archaeon]|nr:MAG: methylated-DNA--[protein]-cysteine S-methyltransferase [Candidatus Thorarchaeota archaeon]
MFYSMFDTAYGTCGVVYRSVEEAGVVHIFLPGSKKEIKSRISILFPESKETTSPKIAEIITDITHYLNGTPTTFTTDLLDTSAFYPFQLKVMKTDWKIPRGKTATYGWIAEQIGTKGVRAVGNANARNPFPIVFPCHRVIRSDRTLGGFGGGLEMKRRLLEMEGVQFDSQDRVHSDHIIR